jgi:outer membrane protein assembly factor BamE (lipoprotein component of BamABCDE complex)
MEKPMKSKILNNFIKAFFISSLLLLTSCKSVDVTGNNIKEADISYIKNNKLTQEQIVERIGSPNITPEFSPNTWYYAFIKTTKSTLTFPSIIEQRILKITFDNAGRAQDVVVMDNMQNNTLKSVMQQTPTPGTDESPVKEFVKNIGRFNKVKKKK